VLLRKDKGAVAVTAYWSYGGGVNSTAGIILTLTDDRFADLRPGLRIVHADTGAEMPQTICYVRCFDEWLREHYGMEIETVSAGSLIEYCRRVRVVPSRVYRWCTRTFKVEPIEAWRAAAGIEGSLIGFDAGEAHRAERRRQSYVHEKFRRYPLIEAGIDRQGCVQIIRAAGLELPSKSGCFICPFGNKARFEDLRTYHPELFELACELERNAERFGRSWYLKDKPLDEWISSPGLDFGEPCAVCELE